MEIVIFSGIQASGKSSFYYRNFFYSHIHISLDVVKTRNREKRLLMTCLDIGQPVVVDNTNPTVVERNVYIEYAKQRDFRIVGYYFESKIKDCIERNKKRDAARHIPEVGIRGTHAKLVIPKYSEGFDELFYVKIEGKDFVVEDWNDEI